MESTADDMNDNAAEMENRVMELIIFSGQARSDAMEALRAARGRQWQEVDRLLASATEAARRAHRIQTRLIGDDEGMGKIPVNLILVHAQDHLMSAMLCRDLVEELISLHRDIAMLTAQA